MRTEITWEYVHGALDRHFKEVNIDKRPHDKFLVEAVLGLYDVLPRLFAHPKLNRHIPLYIGYELNIPHFTWWPAKGHYLWLDTIKDRNKYHIELLHDKAVIAGTEVSIDEVIDMLLDYIHRAQNDNATTNI